MSELRDSEFNHRVWDALLFQTHAVAEPIVPQVVEALFVRIEAWKVLQGTGDGRQLELPGGDN